MESWINNPKTCIFITFIFLSCMLLAVNSSMQNQNQENSSNIPNSNNNNQPTTSNDANENPEIQAFLSAHNKVRLHVGESPFVWDAKLALYARQYAEKRKADCNLIHSNGSYGENIFWGGGNQWTATDAVRLWVREHKYYSRATMGCMPGKMCGHYTQIIWRDSVRLGCARVQCMDGDTFAICNYDPPGNYIGDDPFSNHSNN
ncbi:hypothetical protein ACH5RR_024198 [Cinchona calisaya]|uniref:SCP domain-containing protein n=1 Tax=Cinchona calisaya TaxID=153742 RepID=A0ABD2ZCU2_9GENT